MLYTIDKNLWFFFSIWLNHLVVAIKNIQKSSWKDERFFVAPIQLSGIKNNQNFSSLVLITRP